MFKDHNGHTLSTFEDATLVIYEEFNSLGQELEKLNSLNSHQMNDRN